MRCSKEKEWGSLTVMAAMVFFIFLLQSIYRLIRPSLCSLPHDTFIPPSPIISSKPIPPPPPPDSGYTEGRQFRGYGRAAYAFVEYGSYRGGSNTFAIVGLASKPLHVFGRPGYACEWVPSLSSSMNTSIITTATALLPDWGYGRVYTVVVINCTFHTAVGADSKGGHLFLHASHGHGSHTSHRIPCLVENEGDYNPSMYEKPYPYDFVYCGSSLFGTLHPQRIREWIAYHAKIFGPRSQFMLHDAGGITSEVMEVLKPWIMAGYVTIQDIRQQEEFDGYYYNQFLVLNDCLHRTRFMSNWTFFFDVDEYLYIQPHESLQYAMDSFSQYTQITYEQSPMSDRMCWFREAGDYSRLWGFEKLVFRRGKGRRRLDRKYAVQARNVFATGVHMSESAHMIGKTLHTRGPKIKFYHYHNTINNVGEVCSVLINSTTQDLVTYDKEPYKLDRGMQYFAETVKKFESQHVRLLARIHV